MMTIPPFPWEQDDPPTPGAYIAPNYYDDLLYGYRFGGRSDLDLLDEFLNIHRDAQRVVELGCGSGRATAHIARALPSANLTVVDLSPRMLAHTLDAFGGAREIHGVLGDSIDYLADPEPSIDILVSLWNVSHSVHQHMFRLGRAAAATYVRDALRRFFMTRLHDAAFIVHYDIQSEEQRLINPWRLELWRTADPDYDATGQSPSKLLLDRVFEELQAEGKIRFARHDLLGDPIIYESPERALEVFMNFHMEGHYSLKHPKRNAVAQALLSGFEPYRIQGSNTVAIRPACFVYRIEIA